MSLSSSKSIKLIGFALLLCTWVFISFLISQYTVIFAFQLMAKAGFFNGMQDNLVLIQLVALALSYILALIVIVSIPRLLTRHKKIDTKQELGIDKKPHLLQFGYGLLGYGAYFVLTIIFALIIQTIWPSFQSDQAQDIGFKDLSGLYEYVLVFIALVFIPPLAEEALFRGYLFGKLRKRSNFIVSALITSALFGLVHLQWNVGVDVFALSLVLCYLREKTGHIWIGVFVHMIKNGIAFVLLFLHPEIITSLL